MTEIASGQLVRHPGRPAWGPGKVLKAEHGRALIFFVDAGPDNEAKKNPAWFDLGFVRFQPAGISSHPRLDNLAPLEGESVTGDQVYVSLAQGITRFLYLFPGGFGSQVYFREERGYKWEAHLECVEVLGKNAFRRLLDRQGYEELARQALRVINMVNLLASFELMALSDGLKDRAGQERFGNALFELLHGTSSMEDRFTSFARALESLPQRQSRVLTWPTQTVLPFLFDPARHMFLKPAVTRQAAARCAFDLKYEAQPRWATYSRLLKFCDILFQELRDIKPRDYIDLQSLIWSIGDDSYKAKPPEAKQPKS